MSITIRAAFPDHRGWKNMLRERATCPSTNGHDLETWERMQQTVRSHSRFTPRARAFLEAIASYVVVVGSVARGKKNAKDIDLIVNERHEEKIRRIISENSIPFESVFPGNWTIPAGWAGWQIELLPFHAGPDFKATRKRAHLENIEGVILLVALPMDAPKQKGGS